LITKRTPERAKTLVIERYNDGKSDNNFSISSELQDEEEYSFSARVHGEVKEEKKQGDGVMVININNRLIPEQSSFKSDLGVMDEKTNPDWETQRIDVEHPFNPISSQPMKIRGFSKFAAINKPSQPKLNMSFEAP
jgi:hypothetical protein